MFGYVSPVLSVLSEEQKQRYRSFYCGVCHALQDRHGQIRRLSLSNDMTFLAMLLSSLYEPETSLAKARCLPHPLKAHDFLSSPMIDFAADMNALLFCYKCEDQRRDDHSLQGKAGVSLFRRAAENVKRRWPSQAEGVENALTELWKEEEKVSPDPDRLCNLSGEMLGSAFVPKPEDPWSRVLRSVGCGLGRFIVAAQQQVQDVPDIRVVVHNQDFCCLTHNLYSSGRGPQTLPPCSLPLQWGVYHRFHRKFYAKI